jgi:hypothetical protein
MRAMPRLVSFTLAFALQLRKITENFSQGAEKVPVGTFRGNDEAQTALFKDPVSTAQ